MDCSGHLCHAECDRRHLDPVERRRDSSWAWPKAVPWAGRAPHVIICAGPERSGSTWLYNAVRLLHRQAKVPCDSYWMHTLTEGKIKERLKEGAHLCVKTHEWEPEYSELVPQMAKHVVITHRDLRGVVASYRRVGWAFSIPRKYVDDHMRWRQSCGLDIKYEDVVRDGEAELRALASHIGLALADADISTVHKDLKSLEGSSEGGVDQVTKLWPGHISINTKKYQDKQDCADRELNVLKDEKYCASLTKTFPEYMYGYGYA